MRRALVTGASRGIGAACARKLSVMGFEVGVNYNQSEEEAYTLAEEIGGVPVFGNIGDPVEVERMFDEFDDVEVLVCNAGVSMNGQFQDTAYRWSKVFNINFGGAVNCIYSALPYMLSEKRGRIVTMSSVWGQLGASCESIYAASKAALIGLSKSLAKELGPSGITVNCVAPGVIDTDMNAHYSEDEMLELQNATPLGRLGTPRDVAETVGWLCSERALFITGQVIGVGGGFEG